MGELATVGTTSVNPTSATGGAATSDSTPSQPDKNGGVQTGVTATAVMMLVVISGGVLLPLQSVKREYNTLTAICAKIISCLLKNL